MSEKKSLYFLVTGRLEGNAQMREKDLVAKVPISPK